MSKTRTTSEKITTEPEPLENITDTDSAEITVTIGPEKGELKVRLSPERITVRKKQRVFATIKCPPHFRNRLLGVEIHVPGNEARKLMHSDNGNGRADVVYRTQPQRRPGPGPSFRIGPDALGGAHEYRVYVHFRGSVETKEGKTSGSGRPIMIVE